MPEELILTATAGPCRGLRVSIPADRPMTLGRQAEMAEIPLVGDKFVSRRHATISRVGDQWTVEDLGSNNGTYINGAEVRKHVLRNGDRLFIGDTEFQVEIANAAFGIDDFFGPAGDAPTQPAAATPNWAPPPPPPMPAPMDCTATSGFSIEYFFQDSEDLTAGKDGQRK